MKNSIFVFFFLLSANVYMTAQCDVGGVCINSILADPNSGVGMNFDTDGDGVADALDEFVEICNKGTLPADMSMYIISDDDQNAFAFPAIMLMPGECLLLISNWQNMAVSPPMNVVDLNLGTPWINNDGDQIILTNATDACIVAFGDEECDPISPSPFPCDQWDPDIIDGCPIVAGKTDCSFVPGVLPIELLFFRAIPNHKQVLLSWATSTEINNEGFIVEWSENGVDFIEIARLKGSGNSDGIRNYSYDHNRAKYGHNYYRLIQVDFSGAMSYSDVQWVEIEDQTNNFSLQTNLISDYLELKSSADVSYDIHIYSNSGVRMQSYSSLIGNQQIETNSLTSGMYILKVYKGNKELSFKIFKI